MSEAEDLIRGVQEAAASHGHRMGIFQHVDQRTYVGECTRCSMTVIVTPDPGPDESKVMGRVVEVDCPANS